MGYQRTCVCSSHVVMYPTSGCRGLRRMAFWTSRLFTLVRSCGLLMHGVLVVLPSTHEDRCLQSCGVKAVLRGRGTAPSGRCPGQVARCMCQTYCYRVCNQVLSRAYTLGCAIALSCGHRNSPTGATASTQKPTETDKTFWMQSASIFHDCHKLLVAGHKSDPTTIILLSKSKRPTT